MSRRSSSAPHNSRRGSDYVQSNPYVTIRESDSSVNGSGVGFYRCVREGVQFDCVSGIANVAWNLKLIERFDIVLAFEIPIFQVER